MSSKVIKSCTLGRSHWSARPTVDQSQAGIFACPNLDLRSYQPSPPLFSFPPPPVPFCLCECTPIFGGGINIYILNYVSLFRNLCIIYIYLNMHMHQIFQLNIDIIISYLYNFSRRTGNINTKYAISSLKKRLILNLFYK